MLPIVCVPASIQQRLGSYRQVFCRAEGFEWVGRYVTGLLVSPNKTVQGIYAHQVWPDSVQAPSRRAMHASLFESGWEQEALGVCHREQVGLRHRNGGREVLSLDWTYGHHERGSHIYGVKHRYDHVQKRPSRYQILLTAVLANRERIDGLDVMVQAPLFEQEELGYLQATRKDSYGNKQEAAKRLVEVLCHMKHKKAYKKRSVLFREMVQRIEEEEVCPPAAYVFDNGVLSLELIQYLEAREKFWLSELEKSRHIFWDNRYQRIDEVAGQLRTQHPESFRQVTIQCRNGEMKTYWVFTKCARLKRYGKKRIFIVHEREDLSDDPHFLLTNALHWEAKKALQTRSYRWTSEIFHEIDKQDTGLESAQVRNQDAVEKHVRLSCVAQSILQDVVATPSTSERFAFAKGQTTSGQRCHTLTREVFKNVLHSAKLLFEKGMATDQILDQLMPA